MKPSEHIDNFLKRLEVDEEKFVSIYTVRMIFLPRIVQLEAENERLRGPIEEALCEAYINGALAYGRRKPLKRSDIDVPEFLFDDALKQD